MTTEPAVSRTRIWPKWTRMACPRPQMISLSYDNSLALRGRRGEIFQGPRHTLWLWRVWDRAAIGWAELLQLPGVGLLQATNLGVSPGTPDDLGVSHCPSDSEDVGVSHCPPSWFDDWLRHLNVSLSSDSSLTLWGRRGTRPSSSWRKKFRLNVCAGRSGSSTLVWNHWASVTRNSTQHPRILILWTYPVLSQHGTTDNEYRAVVWVVVSWNHRSLGSHIQLKVG